MTKLINDWEVNMVQIYGDFVEPKSQDQECLKIGFSPTSIPLKQRWRNNGLSADFLADYLVTFFPGEDAAGLDRQAEIRNAVSYIANELLENAMKFSYAPSQHAVSISMQLDPDTVRFYTTNCIDPKTIGSFQSFVQHLLSSDPEELYVERLMKNAAEASHSGLGFLTMLHDYNARLAWKFAPLPSNPAVVAVTTMVQLSLS